MWSGYERLLVSPLVYRNWFNFTLKSGLDYIWGRHKCLSIYLFICQSEIKANFSLNLIWFDFSNKYKKWFKFLIKFASKIRVKSWRRYKHLSVSPSVCLLARDQSYVEYWYEVKFGRNFNQFFVFWWNSRLNHLSEDFISVCLYVTRDQGWINFFNLICFLKLTLQVLSNFDHFDWICL